MPEVSQFSGLSCELTIPFSWTELSDQDKDSSALTERDNYSRLQVIQGLEESPTEALEDHPGLAQEIQRLDMKINVLLELVGHIASRESMLPVPCSLRLGPDAIQWCSPHPPPAIGSQLKMELFLERRFPFPLVLSGMVDSLSGENSQTQVRVTLHAMSTPLQELLEKFVFRCHRRHIARMKREGS